MSEKYLNLRAEAEPRLTLDRLDDCGAIRLLMAIHQRKEAPFSMDDDDKTSLGMAHYFLNRQISNMVN